MFSTMTLCEGPMPSVKRLFVAACTVIACCAIAQGWRVYVGITAVPISMRDVRCPAIAMAVIESAPKIWPNHAQSNPSFSSSITCCTSSATVKFVASPCMSPMRIVTVLSGTR